MTLRKRPGWCGEGGWALGESQSLQERESWPQHPSLPLLPLESRKGFKRDKGRTGHHRAGVPGNRGPPALSISTPTHDCIWCFTGSKLREDERTEQGGNIKWWEKLPWLQFSKPGFEGGEHYRWKQGCREYSIKEQGKVHCCWLSRT